MLSIQLSDDIILTHSFISSLAELYFLVSANSFFIFISVLYDFNKIKSVHFSSIIGVKNHQISSIIEITSSKCSFQTQKFVIISEIFFFNHSSFLALRNTVCTVSETVDCIILNCHD
jgi:hypothetical protein